MKKLYESPDKRFYVVKTSLPGRASWAVMDTARIIDVRMYGTLRRAITVCDARYRESL